MKQTTQNRTWLRGALCLAALAAVYLAALAYLAQAGLYQIQDAHNDRFFSADDVYVAEHFFSAEMDTSPRIIKHPLLIVLGCLLTRLESAALGPVSLERHYIHIVLLQIAVSLLTQVYLYLALRRNQNLAQGDALLLTAVFSLSFSTVFFTFLTESYIFSALLLTMSFYYAPRGRMAGLGLLGALCAGVTTTNGLLWAAIVLLSGTGGLRKKLLTLALGAGIFCGLTALSPARGVFFSYLLPGGVKSLQSYSDHFPPLLWAKQVFYAFFGSVAFYLHTAPVSPFGEFSGDALSFLPSAPWPVTVLAGLWLGLLVVHGVLGWRDRRLYGPLAVLGLNLLLHGLMQYGLKEAFLYGLHHYPAQVLIMGLGLGAETPAWRRRGLRVFLGLYLAGELLGNLPGYLEMLGTL